VGPPAAAAAPATAVGGRRRPEIGGAGTETGLLAGARAPGQQRFDVRGGRPVEKGVPEDSVRG